MIKEEIQKAIFVSLKAGEKTELKVLRFILSQIKYGEIAKQKELTEEEVIALLQKEVKKRKEAIELFKQGKRDEMVADEEKQVVVIERYLPKQLSIIELEQIVKETINTSSDKSNIGKIIGLVMAKVKGKTDGKIVADLVKKNLK